METLTMYKNCLNCTHSERWSDKMMLKICGDKGLTAHVPRNAIELILM